MRNLNVAKLPRQPYSHYSLLRTIEDASGVSERLGHAADTAAGVKAMTPLFAVHGRWTLAHRHL